LAGLKDEWYHYWAKLTMLGAAVASISTTTTDENGVTGGLVVQTTDGSTYQRIVVAADGD
jgi:hypothetical protein